MPKRITTSVSLPPGLSAADLEALQSLGFRTQAITRQQIDVRLPYGWSLERPEGSNTDICRDADKTIRVRIRRSVNISVPATDPDDLPLQRSLTIVEIINRYKVQSNGDCRFRVFDRHLRFNLVDETSSTRTWATRAAAEAWLDEHYPRWRLDPAYYWPRDERARRNVHPATRR